MRKVVVVAVALLIVLGAVAGTVYVGYSREPGREVAPRNDGDSPDPESVLLKFIERPSSDPLQVPPDEGWAEVVTGFPAGHPAVLNVFATSDTSASPPASLKCAGDKRHQQSETATSDLPVGLPSGPRFLGVVS
ncbi:hypothetical protein [Thermococcus sp. 9N3]|uniref:hypothetical protein n=1 Tax=Thermococcus sp. 9N3 TaxID=163002 RepID=UPI0014307798|nr:hypothetical protein [Thermococcus sp. 9N3]NJE48655.1 hypothetical protein [Thermococcus sp. 9N3]